MRYAKTLVAVVCLLSFSVTSCANQLFGKISFPTGSKSGDQPLRDILVCKDRVHTEMAKWDFQSLMGAAFIGLTVVGVPYSIAADRAKERKIFAECMTALGYTVLPPGDDEPEQGDPSTAIESSAKDDVINKMENLKSMRDRGLISEEEYNRKRKELLDRM